MEVEIEEDGRERLGAVWDYREDPEGMAYGYNMIKQCKIDMVNHMIEEKAKYRKKNLGFVIQEAEDQISYKEKI